MIDELLLLRGPLVDESIARVYRRGRLDAARQTELSPTTFPVGCPFTRAEVLGAELERRFFSLK